MVGAAITKRFDVATMETQDGALCLWASQPEFAVRVRVGAKCEREGVVEFHQPTLQELIKVLPPERIELSAVKDKWGETFHVQMRDIQANLKAANIACKFEQVYREPSSAAQLLTVDDPDSLAAAIGRIAPYASKGDARPVLQCLNLSTSGESLYLAGADGFRLAHQRLKIAPLEREVNVNIPVQYAQVVANQIKEGCAIVLDSDSLHLTSWGVQLRIQYTEGRYPNLESFLTANTTFVAYLNKADALTNLRLMRPFARGSQSTVKLSVVGEVATVKSSDDQTGEGEARQDAHEAGLEIDTSLNLAYFERAISNVSADNVRISRSMANGALTFGDPDNEFFFQMVMPMAI